MIIKIIVIISAIVVLGILSLNFSIANSVGKETERIRSLPDTFITNETSYVGTNERTALLLVHGYGNFPHDFKPLLPELKKHGYSYKLILLPGHGTSPKDLGNIKANDWVKKVEREYELLAKKYEEVILIGFSIGGALSIELASRKKVSKLVAISPFIRITSQWYYLGKAEKWLKLLSNIMPYTKKIKLGMINDPKGLSKYNSYKYLPLTNIKELEQVGQLAVKSAPKVLCDTVWFHSTNDFVADYTTSRKVYDLIKSKNKNFVVYTKSNHILMFDYDHNSLIKLIMEFIND